MPEEKDSNDVTKVQQEEQNASRNPIEKIYSTTLDLPPSCIEFSPLDPEYFVVGTYHLEKEESTASKDDEGDGDDANEHGNSNEAPKEKEPQSRSGSLILFHLRGSELTLRQTLPYPSAILDLHFSPHKPSLLALASSTGTISLYNLQAQDVVESDGDANSSSTGLALTHHATFHPFPSTTLILSLAWHPSIPSLIGVTLSTGTVSLHQLSPPNTYTTLDTLRDDLSPHDGHFIWTLAFSPPSPSSLPLSPEGLSTSTSTSKTNNSTPTTPQALYTGGDDARLRCTLFPSLTSIRHDISTLLASSPGGAKGLPGHEAGVTAILPLPLPLPGGNGLLEAGKDILLTGSYDDYVRVYAVDNSASGQGKQLGTGNVGAGGGGGRHVLATLRIGGGVWRLRFLIPYAFSSLSSSLSAQKMEKEDEEEEEEIYVFKVLASCMHAGSRILEIKGSRRRKMNDDGESTWTWTWTIEVLGEFTEHRSMNYGSDVQPLPLRDGGGAQEEEWRQKKKRLDDDSTAVCVSTSFYDQLLCVWRWSDVRE